jgi:hypothetical protein
MKHYATCTEENTSQGMPEGGAFSSVENSMERQKFLAMIGGAGAWPLAAS